MAIAKAERSWEDWNKCGLGLVIATTAGMCHRLLGGHPSVKSGKRPGKDTTNGNASEEPGEKPTNLEELRGQGISSQVMSRKKPSLLLQSLK